MDDLDYWGDEPGVEPEAISSTPEEKDPDDDPDDEQDDDDKMCGACHGSGRDAAGSDCKACRGTGKVLVPGDESDEDGDDEEE